MNSSTPTALALSTPQTPFTLPIGEAVFVGENILRHLPGKRLVAAGRWKDREVVAKIYFDPSRHAIHAAREIRGVEAMTKAGVLTPPLLHQTQQATLSVLLFGRIHPAESGMQRWESADTHAEGLETLRVLVTAVAAHHEAGLLQEDLHLDNFLFSNEGLYTLDGGGIQIDKAPLAQEKALNNLALFFAQLQPRYDFMVEALYAHYAQQRKIETDLPRLRERIAKRRAERKKEFLDKAFRRCSAFETSKDRRHFAVWDRRYDSPALHSMMQDPDALMRQGQILKDGNTSTVASVEVDGKQLLIKRYNLKNPLHALNRAFRETRASISWCNAHRLVFYGIATPQPVALIEKRLGPIRRVSYFVCEYIAADNAATYLRSETVPDTSKRKVIENICVLFGQMRDVRIAHGDTKAHNFLVLEEVPYLIDLDAMREYKSPRKAAHAQLQDIKRFLQSWKKHPDLAMQFEACVHSKEYP